MVTKSCKLNRRGETNLDFETYRKICRLINDRNLTREIIPFDLSINR